MTDRRSGTDRRQARTVDFLNAWAGIGVFARVLFMIAIIWGSVWCINALLDLVARFSALLG